MVPDRPGSDDAAAKEVVAAIRTALPTSRHADMALDGILAALGDRAVVATAGNGSRTLVFRRDPQDPDWIIPWPLIQFSRGRRLGYVMGLGEGDTPSDEAPPARDAPPLRLGGLAPGEFEVDDGRFKISVTFGQDGRVAETGRGGSPTRFSEFAQAVRSGRRNPVETLIDHILTLDPGETGPGRLLRPMPSSANIEGAWHVALSAIRQAAFEGHIPVEARWVAAGGYAGAVITTGTTRDEAITRCRAEIRRVNPRPPKPKPPPELSPETLASLGGRRWPVPHHGSRSRRPENRPVA